MSLENICIYLRKSRSDREAEARGEGETLARHEKTLLELAKRRGYHIGAIYKEVKRFKLQNKQKASPASTGEHIENFIALNYAFLALEYLTRFLHMI